MEFSFREILLKAPRQNDGIQAAIREVIAETARVQTCFELESDHDLIESYIYELDALHARYRYLLRVAKEQSLTAQRVPVFDEVAI